MTQPAEILEVDRFSGHSFEKNLCLHQAYVCCGGVHETFGTHFLICPYLFNAKTDEVHIWYACVI